MPNVIKNLRERKTKIDRAVNKATRGSAKKVSTPTPAQAKAAAKEAKRKKRAAAIKRNADAMMRRNK